MKTQNHDDLEAFIAVLPATIQKALQKADKDYTAHVLTAKCLLLQEKSGEAVSFLTTAKKLYPSEAQAWHLSGAAYLDTKQYDRAYEQFEQTDKLLPGNPMICMTSPPSGPSFSAT